MRGLQSRTPNPLLQSSEIPNLGLMAQIGNFWLTPWWHIRNKIIQTIKNPSTPKSTKMTPNYWMNSGKWKLQKKSQSCVENLGQYQLYNVNTKQCLLCLNEKSCKSPFIEATICWTEIINKCRHKNKYALASYNMDWNIRCKVEGSWDYWNFWSLWQSDLL